MTNGTIKVLHAYRTYFPDTQGGGEEVIRQVCLNTLHLGIESRVFSLSPSPSPAPLNRPEAEVTQVKQHLEISSCGISLNGFKTFRRLASWADVLHYHFPWPYGDLLHLCNGSVTHKPAIVSYHSDIVRQRALNRIYRPLMKRFMARIDRIVATSPNYAASSPLLREYQNKTCVIPIGIDEDKFPTVQQSKVEDIQRRYSPDFMFFVGVFRYYKGLQYLLEASKQISTPLVLAGSGPEEASLKRFAREHNLQNVHFVGRISDEEKMAMLAACRAMVFPSHLPSESFGIALLEAAMSGKPMISCEIGTGTSWVNLHGETGLVVAPADPGALAEAINVLSSDDNLCQKFGIAARHRYEKLFTGQAMGRQYADLYTELVAGARQ